MKIINYKKEILLKQFFKSLSKETFTRNQKNEKKNLPTNYCLTIKNSIYNIYSNKRFFFFK